MTKRHLWFSSTIWGAVLAAAAHVASAPRDVTRWFQAAGIVTAAVGAREAIAKNGQGK